MVTDVEIYLEAQDTVKLTWGEPAVPNGPINYYMVRYRPADSELEWQETQPVQMTSTDVQIDCDLVDGATFFNFEVFAVNEVDGIPLAGKMSLAHPFEVCNLHEGENWSLYSRINPIPFHDFVWKSIKWILILG